MIDFDTLEKYAKQLDYHIRAMTDLTDVMRGIKTSIDELRLSQEQSYKAELTKVREDYASLVRQLERIGLPKLNTYEMQLSYIREKLNTGDWPNAIDPDFLHPDEAERANHILDFIVTEYIDGLAFLDYKCGTGHVVHQAANRGTRVAVGFDDKQEWIFSNSDKLIFSCDFEEVRRKAPYDVVLLYDVLDHVNDPIAVLNDVKKLMSDRGRVYLRCHPWCARHGGHLHEKINKAYLHLILDEVELTRLGGYACKFTNKIYKPLQTYRKWFENTGFKIEQEVPIEEDMEDFFHTDSVLIDRLEKQWGGESVKAYTAIQFVDYILSPLELNQKVF